MFTHTIKSSWSRFIVTRGRMIPVGRAAVQRVAGEVALQPVDRVPPRADGSPVERARVAASEDEGGAR